MKGYFKTLAAFSFEEAFWDVEAEGQVHSPE